MKQHLILIQLALIIGLKSSESIRSIDFCNLIYKQCVGNYIQNSTKYNVMCRYEKCQYPFENQCDTTTCAKHETDCSEYLKAEQFLVSQKPRSLISLIYWFNSKHEKMEKSFLSFKSKITNCSKPVYALNPESDVCLVQSNNCFQILYTKTIFGSFRTKNAKQIDCPCINTNNLTFVCEIDNNRKYCTSNEKSCDLFSSNYETFLNINKCQNSIRIF
jgi:hypothetical protein